MTSRVTKAIITVLLLAAISQAQDLNYENIVNPNQAGVVALEKQEDYSLSYKNRRGTHGALLSVSMEKFYPVDYRSLFEDAYIEDIIQDDRIDLVGLELGYKYNIGFLSFSVLGAVSQGSINGQFSGQERKLKIGKQGVSVNVAVDGILNEPWIVPYAQAGAHQFNVEESNSTESLAATTDVSINYKYGLLFQLDWIENSIDKGAKVDRMRSTGLENTYIDIYFAEHQASNKAIDPSNTANEGDPNMFSSGEMGLGLKMEF